MPTAQQAGPAHAEFWMTDSVVLSPLVPGQVMQPLHVACSSGCLRPFFDCLSAAPRRWEPGPAHQASCSTVSLSGALGRQIVIALPRAACWLSYWALLLLFGATAKGLH